MRRDLKIFSIVYVVCLIVLSVAAVAFAMLTQNTPSSMIALLTQIVAPAMTGQLHAQKYDESPKIGYSFKFAFLAALITLVLSSVFMLAMFICMSLYYTSSPTDALGFLWVMSGLASIPMSQWILVTAFLLPIIVIINFTMYKIGNMIMRWTKNRKKRKSEKLLANNEN